jgi:hypothetical protein
MIIEPTPTSPRSPIRRVLRVVGLVLPVLLLGAVVGAGLLGPRPESPPPAPSQVADVPDATPLPTPVATPGPVIVAIADDPLPPVSFEGLTVRPVAEALAGREGASPGAVIAVSGFLRMERPADAACGGEPGGTLGPWCERPAILAEWWWTSMSTLTGPVPPHLHLALLAGVRLPEAALAAERDPGGGGAQVVVIGRFGTPPAGCPGAPSDCSDVFLVERFAWADGVRVGLMPLIAEPLQTGSKRGSPFGTALGEAELPLAAVLTWPDGIARIDPEAAAIAAAGPPSEPVWYVRVLEDAAKPGGDRLVRWMLLADRDFRVIGSGRVPATTADTARLGPG